MSEPESICHECGDEPVAPGQLLCQDCLICLRERFPREQPKPSRRRGTAA